MKAKVLLCILLAVTVVACQGIGRSANREFYVSPAGSPAGDGSPADPWDLQTALNHPSDVQPGDTIWLRGGKYGDGGTIRSVLRGTEESPITVRQYPGERATVNGGIEATREGAWVTFWGFEITNTNPRDVDTENIEELRPSGLNLGGRGYRAVNLVIHDTGHPGIGFWSPVGPDGEVYGCLIWGTGIYENGNDARGSAIYAQNEEGLRYITDNIVFWNFFTGVKPGGTAGGSDGFILSGNVGFGNFRWDISNLGSASPARDCKVLENCTYHQPRGDWGTGVLFGFNPDSYQGDAEIRDNYFVGGVPVMEIRSWQTLTVTGNTVVGGTQALVELRDPAEITEAYWDHNAYFSAGSSTPFQYQRYDSKYDLTGWQSVTGLDAHSTLELSLPTGTKVMVRPNKYEPGRGHVIAYNWDLRDTVSVDVSSVLNVGDAYRVQDAQNFFGEPVAAGVYDGKLLTLPMNLTEKAELVGDVWHFDRHERHTAPEFAVFVVLPEEAPVTPEPTEPPTDTPEPTNTAAPTETPVPTDTLTAIPTPTATSTSIPTETPTATPTSTNTPTETMTPEPTDTVTPGSHILQIEMVLDENNRVMEIRIVEQGDE